MKERDHTPQGPLTRHSLGKLIEAARQDQGLTVEQLAGRVGVTSSTLRRYEVGRNMPPFDSMVLIAHQLGLPMRMFDSGDPLEEGELIAQPVARDPIVADLHTTLADLQQEWGRIKRLLQDVRRVSTMVSHQVADLDSRLDHLEAVLTTKGTGRGTKRHRSGGPTEAPTHEDGRSATPQGSISPKGRRRVVAAGD